MSETTGIEEVESTIGTRPLPAPEEVSAPYWAAAARGELLYQECPVGHRQLYPRLLCATCGADVDWRTASGRGTVHTFTVVRQNWAEPFKGLVPYVVAMVELDEGPRLMTNVIGVDPAEVHIGMAVEVHTVSVEDGLGIPFFRPAAGSAAGGG